MKSLSVVFGVFLLVGCNIVELEENSPATESDPINDSSIVNLGDNDLPSDAATLAQMLHNNDSKTWAANEFSIEGLSSFLSCRLDDTITLFSDGTYTYDGGESLCGGEDNERNRTGNWAFDFETQALIFEPGTTEESTATLVTLDAGLLTFTGIYQSNLFGSFDVEGRYTSTAN
ncbi:MAG: hypothetical protein AAGA66_01130 [Bacteroidota bacterium]